MPFFHRFLMSYGVTDEIFGVSVCKSGVLSPYFSYGLMAMAVPGWTIGTLLGAVSGSLLPARLLSALNVALYGMFLAVVTLRQEKIRFAHGYPCFQGTQLPFHPDTGIKGYFFRI